MHMTMTCNIKSFLSVPYVFLFVASFLYLAIIFMQAELSSEDTHLLLSCQYLAPKFAASFASPSEHKPSRRESFKCTKHSLDSIDTFSSMGIGDCESAYEGVGV